MSLINEIKKLEKELNEGDLVQLSGKNGKVAGYFDGDFVDSFGESADGEVINLSIQHPSSKFGRRMRMVQNYYLGYFDKIEILEKNEKIN